MGDGVHCNGLQTRTIFFGDSVDRFYQVVVGDGYVIVGVLDRAKNI